MALAWKITYTIKDAKNQRGYVSFWYRDSPDNFLDAYTPAEIASEGASELDTVIDGVIESVNISFNVQLPVGLRLIPDVNSDIEEGLTVVYETAMGTLFKQRIPTIQEQYVPATRRYTDYPAIPFVDWLLHPEDFLPGAGQVLGATDGRGLDLKRVKFYSSSFKASKNQKK